MKIVLANGCFDVLHVGHARHLREAKEMGDILIVSLTLDANVNKGPGRPVNAWEDRRELLMDLRCVHSVVPTATACDAIRAVRPDIFVKGIDYVGGKAFSENILTACREVGAEIRYTQSEKRSATEIIKRALELA